MSTGDRPRSPVLYIIAELDWLLINPDFDCVISGLVGININHSFA